VPMMTEELWNSGEIDRRLAMDLAFSDVGYQHGQSSRIPCFSAT
jgi:hypothetical protein